MKPLVAISIALTLLTQTACKSTGSNTTDTVKAPSALTAEPLDGGAHLTWHDNSDNEAEFTIERKMNGEDWQTIGMVPFNTTSFHDPKLMDGATYMYRVMAMPKSGEHGPYSNEAACMGPGGSGAAGGGAHDVHHAGGSAGGA